MINSNAIELYILLDELIMYSPHNIVQPELKPRRKK